MKFLNLLFLILFTFSNTFAQSRPQTFNKLEVEKLKLPKESGETVLILNSNNEVQSSGVGQAELETLAGINSSETIQERLETIESDVTELKVDTSNIDNTSDLDKPISTATQSALNLKANDADVVHKTGSETVAGNKTFTGEVNLNGVSQPCVNKTNTEMLALAPTTSKCVYNTDKKSPFFYDVSSSKWKQAAGSGGMGGVNYITNYSFEDDASGWVLYSDAAGTSPVDGTGGTSTLTMTASVVTPLIGERSLVVAKGASNLQGQGFSYDFKLEPAYISKLHTIEFPYKTSSSFVNGDMAVFLYDKTNSAFVKLDKSAIELNTANGLFTASFTATTSLDYRLIVHQASTTTASYSIYLDNVKVSPFSDKFAMFNADNVQTDTLLNVGNLTTTTNLSLFTSTPSDGSGIYTKGADGITLLRDADVRITYSVVRSGAATGISAYVLVQGTSRGGNNFTGNNVSASFSGRVLAGQKITFSGTGSDTSNSQVTITATATTPALLGQTDTFSTDSANLFFKSTACTSSEIGCFNTYSYAANTNTRTLCTTAPTQTTSHMNTNGIQIFTRAYNAASTCASPAVVNLVVGKGMKGVDKILYKNAGKTTPGSLELTPVSSATHYGATFKSYDENTGFILVDSGASETSVTFRTFNFSDVSAQSNGYLVINASKSPVVMGQMLGMARYIVKTYSSGTDWYEIYNDGWVRQGGYSNNAAATATVSLLVANVGVNYSVTTSLNATGLGTTPSNYAINVYAQTSTTFSWSIDAATRPMRWVAEGYGASAAVTALGATPSY